MNGLTDMPKLVTCKKFVSFVVHGGGLAYMYLTEAQRDVSPEDYFTFPVGSKASRPPRFSSNRMGFITHLLLHIIVRIS